MSSFSADFLCSLFSRLASCSTPRPRRTSVSTLRLQGSVVSRPLVSVSQHWPLSFVLANVCRTASRGLEVAPAAAWPRLHRLAASVPCEGLRLQVGRADNSHHFVELCRLWRGCYVATAVRPLVSSFKTCVESYRAASGVWCGRGTAACVRTTL